ncbi:hypothetical protein QCA50_018609 [Cerrena zonata]|uniref:ATP synthase F0 subunit 8 n=1 Tax=Cerrena zonata TaxID=2478898 RepID=A0AAW0FLB8_9APHY
MILVAFIAVTIIFNVALYRANNESVPNKVSSHLESYTVGNKAIQNNIDQVDSQDYIDSLTKEISETHQQDILEKLKKELKTKYEKKYTSELKASIEKDFLYITITVRFTTRIRFTTTIFFTRMVVIVSRATSASFFTRLTSSDFFNTYLISRFLKFNLFNNGTAQWLIVFGIEEWSLIWSRWQWIQFIIKSRDDIQKFRFVNKTSYNYT